LRSPDLFVVSWLAVFIAQLQTNPLILALAKNVSHFLLSFVKANEINILKS